MADSSVGVRERRLAEGKDSDSRERFSLLLGLIMNVEGGEERKE